jgi:hypothetical protein
MMIVGAITFALLLAAALAAYWFTTRLSERMPSDVYPFLLSVDVEELNGMFHPEAEERYRQTLSPEEFRTVQWKRIHLALHFCNKVTNNVRVFLGWMKYERGQNWDRLAPELKEAVLCLRDTCVQCRLASLMIRLRLHWWLVRMDLLPFLPPPSFQDLLGLGSADMISFYETALTLADAFSRIYGADYHQKLVQAL